MKALIVYDSLHGNTEKIAKSIASTLGSPEDVRVLRVAEAKPGDLEGQELLVAGSPTHGFNASVPMRGFLASIPAGALKGIDVAAFDTRIDVKEIKNVFFRFFLKRGSYAAGRIAGILKKNGGNLVVPPEGFIVKGTKGPLREGEIERAVEWAKKIIESYH